MHWLEKETNNPVNSHDFTENNTTKPIRRTINILEKKTHLIRFLVRIRGARTPPPKIEEPVTNIPLWHLLSVLLTKKTTLQHIPSCTQCT
jgi:hypothetical protein